MYIVFIILIILFMLFIYRGKSILYTLLFVSVNQHTIIPLLMYIPKWNYDQTKKYSIDIYQYIQYKLPVLNVIKKI